MLAGRAAWAVSWSYLGPGTQVSWQAARGPRPTVSVGVRALATLAALHGGTQVPPPPAPELSPWRDGPLPLGGKNEKGTVVTLAPGERVWSLRARTSFRVGAELSRLGILRLRLRYRDGLVVTLNGQEVVRRHVGTGATALRPRGPEWEDVYLPVTPGLLVAGENTLELEARSHRTRPLPLIDLRVDASEHARLVRGPIVQRVGRTSATIVFETDTPVGATLEATWTGGARSLRSAPGVRHVLALDGLPPGAAITYAVRLPAEASATRTFHLAPDPREPLRLAIYGDVRSGHDVHAGLVAALLAAAPDLVLTTGDMVLRGSDEGDWQRYFAVAGALLAQVPVYPAIGNHDIAAPGTRHLEDIFVLPPGPPDRPAGGFWWSTDFAGLHLVSLDSNRYDDAAQLAWLEADLAAARARGVRGIIAMTHDGPYSRGIHGGNQDARERYVPVLVRHGVTLLVSGHDHLYQRGEMDGLTYVVSGGGGAPLYAIRCGVPGKRACKVDDGMRFGLSEYHWLDIEIRDRQLELCPRRADGTLLEKCVTLPLR
jgi:hypothetical protein